MVKIEIKIKEDFNMNLVETNVSGCKIQTTIRGLNVTKAENDVANQIKEKIGCGKDEITNTSNSEEANSIEELLKKYIK